MSKIQDAIKERILVLDGAMGTMIQQYRLDEAGWVANRWCELLPINLSARQKLMELPDPQTRLRLVDQFLRSRQVVGD